MGDFLRAHLLKIVIVVALIWAWKYWNDSHRYVANSNGGIYDSREGRYVSKTPVVEEEKTSATPKSPGRRVKIPGTNQFISFIRATGRRRISTKT
jgi:hypothetical protein